MRKHILLILLMCGIFLMSPSFGWAMEVKNVNASAWPLVKVSVELPDSVEPARAYQLTIVDPDVEILSSSVHPLDNRLTPASTVFALDTGNALCEGQFKAVKSALGQYAEMFGGEERLALLAFNTTISQRTSFINDKGAFREAVDNLSLAGGESDVLNAIRQGIQLLMDQPGDKTLIVLTEGLENAGAANMETVLRLAHECDVRVLALELISLRELGKEVSCFELRDLTADADLGYRLASSHFALRDALSQSLLGTGLHRMHEIELTFDLGDRLLVNPASTLFSARLSGVTEEWAAETPLILDVSDAVRAYPDAAYCLISQETHEEIGPVSMSGALGGTVY